MSLFNWFSSKPVTLKNAAAEGAQAQRGSKPGQAADKILPAAAKQGLSPDAQMVDRKVKRHARREQLYVAIRECMTRAGVLSASYKFKVLSLDQRGDQFMVMMDVAPGLGNQGDKLSEIETLLVSTAKSLFSIYVTAVYWRTDSRPAAMNATKASNANNAASPVNPVNFGVSQPAALESQPPSLEVVRPAMKQPGAQRYDPIHDDEMAAFKLALVAASASSPATPDATGKSRSGLRSFTLITGFEDTELPESSAAPALSATQYGELR